MLCRRWSGRPKGGHDDRDREHHPTSARGTRRGRRRWPARAGSHHAAGGLWLRCGADWVVDPDGVHVLRALAGDRHAAAKRRGAGRRRFRRGQCRGIQPGHRHLGADRADDHRPFRAGGDLAAERRGAGRRRGGRWWCSARHRRGVQPGHRHLGGDRADGLRPRHRCYRDPAAQRHRAGRRRVLHPGSRPRRPGLGPDLQPGHEQLGRHGQHEHRPLLRHRDIAGKRDGAGGRRGQHRPQHDERHGEQPPDQRGDL